MSDLFEFESAARLYAVMGNPVAHSQSPQIHQQFAEQFGLRIDYRRIQVDPGGFEQAVANFRTSGGCGLNITVPFKLNAWRLSEQCSPRAELAQSVNTIVFTGTGGIFGENTDGVGIQRDITDNLQQPIAGRRVLIIGAGGAVRGIIGPILERAPAAVVVANRTVDRAIDLAQRFGKLGHIVGCGLDDLSGQAFDIVINGTSTSMTGQVPAIPDQVFNRGALAYDMMYAEHPTAFMAWAMERGADRASDGVGMLVEQAAESFLIWHGKTPDTGPVIQRLQGQHAY